MKIQKSLLALLIITLIFSACSDSKDGKVPEYDANKELIITGFIPDSGGIAEQFILKGTNFGTDISKIKLYFNDKPAAIISAAGERILALAPRLPGEYCDIRLQIEDQEIIAEKQFHYISAMTVSTVTGAKGANGGKFKAGSLTDAAFSNLRSVVADSYGNLFVSQYGNSDVAGVVKIDIPNNDVSWAADVAAGAVAWNTPTIDRKTDIIYYPGNTTGVILELNPTDLWFPRVRRLKSPTIDGKLQWIDAGWWANVHSLAWSNDDFLYTRTYAGRIAKINPNTWEATFLMGNKADGIIDGPVSNSYVAINPHEPDWLYLSYESRHCIKRYHLKEHYFEDFVGGPGGGAGGWKDGVGADVMFKNPRGICFDSEGVMFVVDASNHCIRRVSPNREVSTLAGIPQKAGDVDGKPLVAQFQNPWAICVDKDDNIFVAEPNDNRKVRKITLE